MTDDNTKPASAGSNFIEHTKYHNLLISDQLRGYPAPPLQPAYDPALVRYHLPDPLTAAAGYKADIHQVIPDRSSIRSYRDKPVTGEMLSLMLWETQGVKKNVRNIHTLRTVPSAGARHALETWLLINRVEGITPGLYRYLPLIHSLLQVSVADDIAGRFTKACLDQQMVRKSAVTFFWTAEIYRMKWRYSERAYRYIFLDAGHVCQNLYLSAQSMGCGVCAIAAFDDDLLNAALGVDGESQFAIYAASCGLRV